MNMAERGTAMKRAIGGGLGLGHLLVTTALAETCGDCGARLQITQHRGRWIQRLDGPLHVVRRDKKCRAEGCPGTRSVFHAPEDLRLALPYRTFGLDVTLCIGERHLRGESLTAIGRDLGERGILIDQRHTGRVFRDFLAVTSATAGDEESCRAALRAQGGIVLMCDGVQFDDRAPVLYLAWDARSSKPLFGERKPFRSEKDLCSILERVKAMDVPVLGIVSDKEKGLVPAVQAVFPDVPYQFCHTHFLKNCARPLEGDLTALGASVIRRATRVHRIAKRLHEQERATPEVTPAPTEAPAAPTASSPTEVELAREVCELARQNSRVSGKAPLDPPELERHERLETLRRLVEDAPKKKGRAAAF